MTIISDGVSEISKKFKQFSSDLFEIWEDYLFIDFYLPILHKCILKEKIPDLQFEYLYSEDKTTFTKKFIYGVIDRIKKKQMPERALLEMVALFETYMQSITYRIYRDFPTKLETLEETQTQQIKIIRTIIDSSNREEIIEKISEEKIRNIFYGKPLDFFVKDKAKIGLNTHFKTNYNLALKEFEEIIARRNVYTHNRGKIDRKYLREVDNTPFQLGNKAPISKEYIKESIKVLIGLSAKATQLILKNNYHVTDYSEKLTKQIELFDKTYKGK